jgi:DNA repair protein SbcD/Mre11
MRFLHTADWHIGKSLRGRCRMDEYEKALGQVADVARQAEVDAVLVAGDIFDSTAPPPEAEKLVFDFLSRLIRDGIPCVLIAGNHDHPKKLSALRGLLENLNVHVRAEVRPGNQGGVVGLRSRDGKEEARIAVLPFVPERKVVDACAVMGPEFSWYEAYAGRVEQILGFLTRDLTPDTVNLLVAHILVAGARFGTGERQLHLGEIYGVNAEQLPGKVQYVALGHLHRPQELMAPTKTCYSGSLIELDFGEREQDKRVVVVEAHPGRAASIESVPLSAGRRLRDVAGTLPELEALASEVRGDFLRVIVKAEGPTPHLADAVREMLPDALEVAVDYPREAAAPDLGACSRRTLEPAELFAQFYRRKNAAEPSDALRQLFQDVYEEARS